MEYITLTKLNIIGEWFFNVFVDSQGNKIEEEITGEEYDRLGLSSPTNPIKDGYTWKYSYSAFKYDSPSGKIEEKTYANNMGTYIVMIDGWIESCLEKSKIVEGKITKTDADEMIANIKKSLNIQ